MLTIDAMIYYTGHTFPSPKPNPLIPDTSHNDRIHSSKINAPHVATVAIETKYSQIETPDGPAVVTACSPTELRFANRAGKLKDVKLMKRNWSSTKKD